MVFRLFYEFGKCWHFLEVIASVEIAVEHSESGKLYESMTSFGHQKNSAPHHLLEALTPVSYTYGFIDFC